MDVSKIIWSKNWTTTGQLIRSRSNMPYVIKVKLGFQADNEKETLELETMFCVSQIHNYKHLVLSQFQQKEFVYIPQSSKVTFTQQCYSCYKKKYSVKELCNKPHNIHKRTFIQASPQWDYAKTGHAFGDRKILTRLDNLQPVEVAERKCLVAHPILNDKVVTAKTLLIFENNTVLYTKAVMLPRCLEIELQDARKFSLPSDIWEKSTGPIYEEVKAISAFPKMSESRKLVNRDDPYASIYPVQNDFYSLQRNLKQLTVEEVATCLELLNLQQYTQKFAQFQVDGELMKTLTEGELKDEFGFSAIEAKKLNMFVHRGWWPKHSKA